MSEQRSMPTPASSRLLPGLIIALAALGLGRFALRLAGLAVLGGVVLATVVALTVGILVLHGLAGG